VIVRHDRHPRPPDEVEDREIGRPVKYLCLGSARLADRLLESTRILDRPGHDFTDGLNGRAFDNGVTAVGFEPIQIEHGV
jgi:hypothetical protein